MKTTADADASATLDALAALVVKDRVSLGGLPPAQRHAALALLWAGLPAAAVLDEPAVNATLKAQLAGAAVWLATDHVELRRWLVDGGWLQRDGFGREYRRVPAPALGPALQPHAAALATIEPTLWVSRLRDERHAQRQRRHHAWQAGQRAAP